MIGDPVESAPRDAINEAVAGYVIQLPADAYHAIYRNLHPAVRYVNMQQWKFPHFWMYSPDGSVVIFTISGTIKGQEHAVLKGFAVAS